MKETSKKLLCIFIIAFACFLIAFGKAFYEYGLHADAGFEGVAIAFLFPIYYFILTVVALVLMHDPAVYKRPYIIMAVLSIGFISVMWIVYVCVKSNVEFSFGQALWYPIVLSVLSLAMTVAYISIIADIIKIDNKIKQNSKSTE